MLAALFFAAGLILHLGRAGYSHDAAKPGVGLLVLKNGEVLQGDVRQQDDRYLVAVEGGEISVRVQDVDFACRDLHEAYLHKRGRIRLDNARDHVELADWCQRHGMLGCAGRELEEARLLDPAEPTIPLVLRRVQAAMDRIDAPERSAPEQASALGVEGLDGFVRGLPAGAVETFTQTIQPLLNNHCATAGCHGPGAESEFRLLRIPSGRPASRRTTQRNLQATMEWIDHANPAASPILALPIRPHGTAVTAVFGRGRLEQYREMANWVRRVARPPSATVVADDASEPTVEPPSRAVPAVFVPPDGLSAEIPASFNLPLPGKPGEPLPDRDAAPPPTDRTGEQALGPSATSRQDPQLLPFQPADPFDPRIFNRRFFPAENRSQPQVDAPGL